MDAKEIIETARKRCQPPTWYRLAKRLHVRPESVYRWRDGKAHPTGQHLIEMLRMAAEKAGKGSRAAALALVSLCYLGLFSQPQDAAAKADVPGIQKAGDNLTFLHIIRVLLGWLRVGSRYGTRPIVVI